MARKRTSLSRRFTAALIGVVTVILFGFSAAGILLNVRSNREALRRQATNLANFTAVSLDAPMWNMDEDAVKALIDALLLDEKVVFVNVVNLENPLATHTRDPSASKEFSFYEKSESFAAASSEISHSEGDDREKVGSIQLALSAEDLRKRTQIEVLGILTLTIIIVAAISLTTIAISRKSIFNPLLDLENSASVIAGGDLDLPVEARTDDEIGTLARAFDGMRTSLRARVEDLNQAREQLEDYSRTLEDKVDERTSELRDKNAQLEDTLSALRDTQEQLLESEKLAALGGLVAGVAHEINTPVGIGITAASHLQAKAGEFGNLFNSGKMKKSDLTKFLDTATQSSELLLSNLDRAGELIQSFKQVAVDQSSEEMRDFMVKQYFDEILLSLRPALKKTAHAVQVNCTPALKMQSYPGAFSQIFTNLVMNSLIHAYEEGDKGTLTIDVTSEGDAITIDYADDGKGIPPENLEKIFEPFFTTRRNQGGSGLGMHIVYNLIVQKLKGSITCESTVGKGTRFHIGLPLEVGEA